MLSVIIPAYNEELMIEKAYFTISDILKNADIENEIIFVDDGSSDNTYERIKTLADKESNISGLHKIPEKKGFFRAISFWVGYKKATVKFQVNERTEGTTKWSLVSLMKYAVSNISAYTTAPMQIVTVLGFIMLAITVVFGVWAFIDKIQGRALEGMTTVILILIFIGSIMMISLGIIGYYVARIYEEIKGRPKYIISSSCKGKKNN